MLTVNLTHKLHETLTLDLTQTFLPGQITALVGESGQGKSSLLNLISGILTPQTAHIYDEVQTYVNTENKYNLPLHQRQLGYVRQTPYLFNHLTVLQNLQYGICERRNQQLNDLIQTFELTPHLKKYPNQLSGGEAQRVNFVRTLLTNPRVLLLDEPFSALDTRLRQHLGEYLKQLKSLNIPILFITHDIEEAVRLSDEILVIHQGKVIERHPSEQFLEAFETLTVARYLGLKNIDEPSQTVILPKDIQFSKTGDQVQIKRLTSFLTHVEVEVLHVHTQRLLTVSCSVETQQTFDLYPQASRFIQIRQEKVLQDPFKCSSVR